MPSIGCLARRRRVRTLRLHRPGLGGLGSDRLWLNRLGRAGLNRLCRLVWRLWTLMLYRFAGTLGALRPGLRKLVWILELSLIP